MVNLASWRQASRESVQDGVGRLAETATMLHHERLELLRLQVATLEGRRVVAQLLGGGGLGGDASAISVSSATIHVRDAPRVREHRVNEQPLLPQRHDVGDRERQLRLEGQVELWQSEARMSARRERMRCRGKTWPKP